MFVPKIKTFRVTFKRGGAIVSEGDFRAMFPVMAIGAAMDALRSQNARVKAGETVGIVVENYDTVSAVAL